MNSKSKLISLCGILAIITFVCIILNVNNENDNTLKVNEEDYEFLKLNFKLNRDIYLDIIKERNELHSDTAEVINMDIIEDDINEYLKDRYLNVGLMLYDINSNQYIAINENKEFIGASTYKVFMNIVAYESVKEGNSSLDDYLYYSNAFYEGGTGILQNEYFTSLDLQTLLDYSIIYSDNIATNMVTSYLGGMSNMLYNAGQILNEDICTSDNIVTPKEMCTALKFIYDNKEEENYAHLINKMTKTIFNDRLDKDLPKDIVAHKIGSYGGYIHDVGIIFDKDNPYIIVVYTEFLENASDVISDISNIIYKKYLSINNIKRYGFSPMY